LRRPLRRSHPDNSAKPLAAAFLPPLSPCGMVWYIFAIMQRFLAVLAVIFAIALAPLPAAGQPNRPAAGSPSADSASQEARPEDRAAQLPQPRITIATPPPIASQQWQMRDWVAWTANVILVFLAYYGIMLGVRISKRIEQQSVVAAETAQAALDAAKAASTIAESVLDGAKSTALVAQAAADSAQAIVNAERPWIMISIEASREVKNHFRIMAVNRGRTPAEVVASSDRIGLAIDEMYLPKPPEYAAKESSALPLPIILLPGESMVVQPFGREDVKWVCKTQERLRQVELWQDKIFIYGKVAYRDLISSHDRQLHETNWCCRYIHGESSSDLVMSGPLEYNKHT
jgi:hypothetical protein